MIGQEQMHGIREEHGSYGIGPTWLATCPVCGFEYAHHRAVEVFVREKEDAQSYVLYPGVSFAIIANDNPSRRRGAVRIHFWGECGHEWVLDFIQHKGITFIVPRAKE